MRAAGHVYDVLSSAEEDTIHANLLRLTDRVGLLMEDEALLERLAAIGGRVDRRTQRVTFSPETTETFLDSCDRVAWVDRPPELSCVASVYHGRYLDPETQEFLPMTVERMGRYFELAKSLGSVHRQSLLGCPLEDVQADLEPLYERLWAWRLGAYPGGSIHRLDLCPYLLEMCQVHAAQTGLPLDDVFDGAVYLIPPLKLGRREAQQVAWFLERDLRVRIGGSMPTGGATAPVTLAGMVTLTIAEALLCGMLNRALYGDRSWSIWMSVTAMDPRTMHRPYGRPDMVIANLMGAQMARRYGAGYSGHSGLTDAMRPSPQAAAQKVQSALPTMLASGRASIEAGLLGVDEVFSPVQMVLDDELASSLCQFTKEYEVSDASIAADLVALVGPGGSFASESHTANWFRRELWEPTLWDRRPFSSWHDLDGRADVDRARERVLSALNALAPTSAIGVDEERRLRRIIERAAQNSARRH